jgi:hypothetical protein
MGFAGPQAESAASSPAGRAKDSIELYYAERGWPHIEEAELVDEATKAKEWGFGGTKVKVGRPHVVEDVRRLSAVRDKGLHGRSRWTRTRACLWTRLFAVRGITRPWT